ncbi:MAG: Bbp16 family capsid cement protein [Syntrophobacteraceae bacterium]|jgi:hypothetical protein
MIMDNLLLLDGSVSAAGVLSGTLYSAWTVGGGVGDQPSANVIDVSQLASSASGYGRDVGIGDDPALLLVVQVATTFSTGSSPTLQVRLQTAPDSGTGTIGAYVDLVTTPVLAASALTAGTELLKIPLPVGIQKFIRVLYTVGTAAFTAGAVIASIVLDREALGPQLGYRSGYSNTYI